MYCSRCGAKVEPNTSYCNKCGFYLNNSVNNVQSVNNIQNTQQPINNINVPSKKNKNMIFVGIGAGTGIIIIILIVSLIVKGNHNSYYFSDDSFNNNNEAVIETSNSNSNKSKGSTIIITDNIYNGVSIKNISDANKLISKDSTDQKSKCPSEILKIENEIIKKYGITAVNLCEMDVEFAREMESVFELIYNEYPAARGHITNLTLRNTSILSENGVIAAFMPVFNFATADTDSTYPWVIKTQVLLSSPYFLNRARLESAVEESSKTGHFPPNSTIYSPVAHELGHYLSFLAMMNNYNVDSILMIDSNNVNTFYKLYSDFGKGDYSLDMLKAAYENYRRDTNTTLSFDEWRGTISEYALAKDNSGNYIYDESVAEAFHDVYLNSNNAKDASKYIVNVLKERLKG